MKIREKLNKIENRKQKRKINETKARFFKISTTTKKDKILATLTK